MRLWRLHLHQHQHHGVQVRPHIVFLAVPPRLTLATWSVHDWSDVVLLARPEVGVLCGIWSLVDGTRVIVAVAAVTPGPSGRPHFIAFSGGGVSFAVLVLVLVLVLVTLVFVRSGAAVLPAPRGLNEPGRRGLFLVLSSQATPDGWKL